MSKKNRRAKYKKDHEYRLKRYEEQRGKHLAKLQRRREKYQALQERVAEKAALKNSGKLDVKHTKPVIGSKIKQQKMLESTMEKLSSMNLERRSVMDRFGPKPTDAAIDGNSDNENDSDMSETEKELERINRKRSKSRRQNRSYKKEVKIALKRASKRPILVKRRMDID